ncbi:hypothetical protein N9C74_03545, partial [Pontimonas sp.]|nr:hypothetical protein [Pontimonas sp.]
MTKFVLCRPLGGLNDCLNQIALCAKYALREGRILVIDTQFSGLGEQFDEVFQLVDFPLDFRVYGPALLEELQTCSAFPAPVGGRLDSYRVISKPGVLGVFEELSGTRLSFNFRKSYSEDLVVHHNGGGGEHSRYLLPYLTLAAEVRRRVVAELDELPLNYFAIHVRNTDYQTPFASLFHRVQKEVIASGMPVLVASDDRAVISEAKKYFGGRLIEW